MSDIAAADQALQDIIARANAARAALLPASTFPVNAGASFQQALEQELPIVTEGGARFPGSFSIPSGRKILFGAGSGIDGASTAAITVKPGQTLVTIQGGRHTSQSSEAVIQIGVNDASQTQLEDQPTVIRLIDVEVPTHRGKRALALHGYGILVSRCKVRDVWSSRDQDSQAIYIGNARGEIDVEDCELEAGTQQVLVGGATVMTPGLHPQGLRFKRNKLTRPLAWMTDADSTKRRIKNAFELKDALDVEFSNNLIDGVWYDARTSQGCFAILLTPALDGNKKTPPAKSGVVGNVLLKDNLIVNVGSGMQLIGRHYQAVTDPALHGVRIEKNRFRINKTKFGGFGQLAKIGGEPVDLAFADNVFLQDGSSHLLVYKGDVLDPQTLVSRAGGPVDRLEYTGNVAELGAYGFNVDGEANVTADKLALNVRTCLINGNTFKGANRRTPTAFSTWLPDAEFEALQAVKDLRAL